MTTQTFVLPRAVHKLQMKPAKDVGVGNILIFKKYQAHFICDIRWDDIVYINTSTMSYNEAKDLLSLAVLFHSRDCDRVFSDTISCCFIKVVLPLTVPLIRHCTAK